MNYSWKQMLRGGLLLGFCATTLSLAAADEEFIMGATTHFGHRKGVVDSNLNVFKESGMTSPRDDTAWGHWKPKEGRCVFPQIYSDFLEESIKMGLSPLHILAYHNREVTPGYPKSPEAIEEFAKFAEWMTTTYKGRTRLYQVWNEWDGGCGMTAEFKGQGDPASYAKLLAAAYPRMKKADPDCVVIANSVCTGEAFLEETFKNGVLQNCDGFAFHGYNYGQAGENRYPEAFLKRVKGVIELSKKYNNGVAKPVYLTEIGWPNHAKRGGSEETLTGDYVARMYLLAKTVPEIKGVWWYDFQDDGYDSEYNENNFGIVTPDLTPKDPWFVMRSVSPVIRKGTFLRELSSPNPAVTLLLFAMPDGSNVLAAWTTQPECRKQIIINRGTAPDGALQLLTTGQTKPVDHRWGFREWIDANSNKHSGGAEKRDIFSFTVTGRPVLLSGKLDGIKVNTVKTIDRPALQVAQGRMSIPEQIIDAIPAGSSGATTVKIAGDANYRRLVNKPLEGDKDLSAEFKVTYDKTNLYLDIAVTDDVHSQEFSAKDLWRGDSVQVAFAAFEAYKPAPVAGTEYQLGLTKKGADIMRESSQLKLNTPTQLKLDAKRDGNLTTYKITVPFSEIGVKDPKPGTPVGLSIVINDNDGKDRDGYLHWGDGIGTGNKAPEEYNWIILR